MTELPWLPFSRSLSLSLNELLNELSASVEDKSILPHVCLATSYHRSKHIALLNHNTTLGF